MHLRSKYYSRASRCAYKFHLYGMEVMKVTEDVMRDLKVSKVKVKKVRDTQV